MPEKTIDICALTESWIHADAIEESLKVAVSEGYSISSKPRKEGCRGCGIVLVYNKESVILMEDSHFEFTDAEWSVFKIRRNGKQLDVCLISLTRGKCTHIL